MSIDLTWTASFSASCLHVADALLRGRTLADQTLQTALDQPSQALAAEIDALGLPREGTLAQLTEFSAELDNNRQLAKRAIVKTVGNSRASSGAVERLAGRIAELENAFRAARPGAADELAVRGEPLRQQWEARGPGLLSAVGRLTEENLIVSVARVVLVQPALGGAGAAQLRTNSVRLEAVLTHPDPQLPETLRLGWLLSQLNQDLPIYSDTIRPERLPHLARLAMLPPVLASSELVEWAQLDAPTLRRALVRWYLAEESDRNKLDTLTATLLDWWSIYTSSSPRWTVALAALDEMIAT